MAIKNTGKTAGKGVLKLNAEALKELGVIEVTEKESVTEYDFGQILERYSNCGDTVAFSFSIDEEVLPLDLFTGGE